MSGPRRVLLGFVCNSPAEQNRCYEIASRFFRSRGYVVARRDVLYPARAAQEFAAQLLNLPYRGATQDPAAFKTDPSALEHFLSLHEGDLPNYLRVEVERLMRAHAGYHLAVITTDARSRVLSTMQELGYRFIRIASRKHGYQGDRKYEDNLVEAEPRHTIRQNDFRRWPVKMLEPVLKKMLRSTR